MKRKNNDRQIAELLVLSDDHEKFQEAVNKMSWQELDSMVDSLMVIVGVLQERDLRKSIQKALDALDKKLTAEERKLGIGCGVRKSLDICDNYNFASGKSYEEEEEEDGFPSLNVNEMFSGR